MGSKKAPLRGTSSLYSYLPGSRVIIYRNDHKHIIINQDIFEKLYFKLDDFTAALKEDCIEYVVVEDGLIYENDFFSIEHKRMSIRPDTIIMRNFKGELMPIDPEKFDKYYDVLEE